MAAGDEGNAGASREERCHARREQQTASRAARSASQSFRLNMRHAFK